MLGSTRYRLEGEASSILDQNLEAARLRAFYNPMLAILPQLSLAAILWYGGRLAIDSERREVLLDGASVELTRSEFDLLVVLASRPGRAWSRYELVTRVQGHDYDGYERTVDAHVKNLRRKLGDDPRRPTFLVTVPGIGYKFGSAADD